MKNSPILIIGAHRSGTTFTGKMIGYSDEVVYIRDPFSQYPRPGIFQLRLPNYYTYINSKNENQYYQLVRNITELNFNLLNEFKYIRSPGDLYRILREVKRFYAARINGKRPLLKAATSIFAAEWLHERFNYSVVGLIRHPAAFISSLKRMRAGHPFIHFVNQPLLMKEELEDFSEMISKFSEIQLKAGTISVPDLIDQGILLWNIVYSKMHKLQQKHPEWLFLKHEDISKNPLEYFEKIFDYLGLKFTKEISSKIIEHTTDSNSAEATEGKWLSLKRNSAQNVYIWKSRLSEKEIEKIKIGTEKISKLYYTPDEW